VIWEKCLLWVEVADPSEKTSFSTQSTGRSPRVRGPYNQHFGCSWFVLVSIEVKVVAGERFAEGRVAKSFFDEQQEQSQVKAEIVAKYFNAWTDVMLANAKKGYRIDRIGYVDLFAGPGRYKDGAKSTPLLVLERAIEKPDLAARLVTIFNDSATENVNSLTAAIASLPGLERLKFPPVIDCSEVGESAREMFNEMSMRPTFSFIDPFGYKGLSRGIIQSMIKDWGCDSVFFFNYVRINAGINNDSVRYHMDALFGKSRIDRMRNFLVGKTPNDREALILEELAQALKELGARYILPFRFRRPDGSRTSHALIFVTKNIRGYEIMKDIMARASSTVDQGVPSFEYSPADERCPLLFSLNRPLETLATDLLVQFKGRRMTMREVYTEHNVGTPFIAANYKRVLTDLEASGAITADPPAEKRPIRKGERSFGDNVLVKFGDGR
jgi:three-Cys-motif partner protein